jgi:hypothetical protein
MGGLLSIKMGNAKTPSSDERFAELRGNGFDIHGSSGQVDPQNSVHVRGHFLPPIRYSPYVIFNTSHFYCLSEIWGDVILQLREKPPETEESLDKSRGQLLS